jgi:hypothetical protein
VSAPKGPTFQFQRLEVTSSTALNPKLPDDHFLIFYFTILQNLSKFHHIHLFNHYPASGDRKCHPCLPTTSPTLVVMVKVINRVSIRSERFPHPVPGVSKSKLVKPRASALENNASLESQPNVHQQPGSISKTNRLRKALAAGSSSIPGPSSPNSNQSNGGTLN